MRKLPLIAAALTAAIALSPMPAPMAGEIFICNDGRTLELTPANRAKLKDDPCVADWFKTNKAAEVAEQSKKKEPPSKMQGIPAACKKPWDCMHLYE